MLTDAQLLAAYDAQLRTDAETPSAIRVAPLGPLRLVTFAGGRGFITYRNLGDADAQQIAIWVKESLSYFSAQSEIQKVEWKTRGHDKAPGLHRALISNGFLEEEKETIMVGPAESLVADVPLPAGVALRRITEERDIRAMCAMQDVAFGDEVSRSGADAVVQRSKAGDGMELWIAEHGSSIVCAGRLEPVAGSDFAGIWGGATLPEWRGLGIYRALTAARARSAIRRGKTLIHSDSTDYSRPILERYGLRPVSTTTPYEWTRSKTGR